MVHNLIFYVSVLFFVIASPASHAETLIEALSYAYNNNPEILAQRAYLYSVNERLPQAMSGFKPSVSLGGSLASKRSETTVNGVDLGAVNRNPYSASVDISQPLFNGFSTIYEVRGADNAIKAEKANLNSKEQVVLLDAVTAYMNVVRDEAVLNLRASNEQVLSRKLEATVDRYEVGEITKTDVAQAEARLMGAQAARILAEGELESSRAYYVKVIGRSPANLENEPKQFIDVLPKTLEEAVKTATTNNPSIIAAKYNLNASEEDVGVVRADLLPSVSLKGVASRSWNQSSNNDTTDAFQISANLDVPLYTAGMVNSKLRSAKHVTKQKRNNLDDAVATAREAATRAYKSLSATKAGITATISQVSAARIALEGVEKEAEVGSRTLLDVLDAEQELLDAQVNLIKAKRDEMVIATQLLVAIGQFSTDNINLKK